MALGGVSLNDRTSDRTIKTILGEWKRLFLQQIPSLLYFLSFHCMIPFSYKPKMNPQPVFTSLSAVALHP